MRLRTLLLTAACVITSTVVVADIARERGEHSSGPQIGWSSEVYEVGTYSRLAATADVIVEATVVSAERGLVLNGEYPGDPASPEEGVGMLEVHLKVLDWLKGPADSSDLIVLQEGFDPVSGEDVLISGILDAVPGQVAVWFLNDSGVRSAPGTYFQMTSAGRVVRAANDTALVDGGQPAAGAMCGTPWAIARQELRLVAAQAEEAAPLVPFHGDQTATFVDENPCEQSVMDRARAARESFDSHDLASINADA